MEILRERSSKEQELALIKRLVVANGYYEGNEDLLPVFCEEVYAKSYLLFKSVKNYEYLSSYLTKIVNTTVLSVLKKYSRTQKIKMSQFVDKKNGVQFEQSSLEVPAIKGRYVYDLFKLEVPISTDEEFTPVAADMKKVVQMVQFINSENLGKNYSKIFALRYIYNESAETIAFKCGISEKEVNSRLLSLADIISENLSITR